MDIPAEDRRRPGRPPLETNKRRINVSIEPEIYEEIHKLGLPYPYILKLGLKAHKDNPQLIERIRATEEGNAKLQRLVTRLSSDNAELVLRLRQLDGKVEDLEREHDGEE